MAETFTLPAAAAHEPQGRVPWVIPAVQYLAKDGRLRDDLGQVLSGLCELLVAEGVPVWRFYVGLMTIHPQLRAQSVSWVRDQGISEEQRRHGIEGTPQYIGSPVAEARRTMKLLRHRLEPVEPGAHKTLIDLAAVGATDYLCQAVQLRHGQAPVVSIASDRPGGFSEAEVAGLVVLLDYLAPIVESQVNAKVATTVAETYLGKLTGQRVLDGVIRRGEGQEINAVLWFSDIRDYTRISERLPPERVLAMLNAYYEAVGNALRRQGGEILKFIGDGVMAIFPIVDAMFLPSASAGAVDAARETIDCIAGLNVERMAAGEPEIRFGVGLHVGPVTWGNVGTEDRLDFTVIGPAVNRCARLESLTKALGTQVLTSAEFNAVCPRPLKSLGKHRLRGVPHAVEVFTLPA